VFQLIPLKDCGLPSYKPMTLANLKARFLLDKDDSEAALFMQERVKDAVAHMVTSCLHSICGIILDAFARQPPLAFMMSFRGCRTA